MFYEFKHLGSPDYLKVEMGNDFSFPVHLHQCYEVIVILEGEMEIMVESSKHILKQGEGLLIFPNQLHSLKSTHSKHVLCIFSPRLVQAYSTNVKGKKPANNKFKPDEYLVREISRLSFDSTTTAKKGILYSLCANFDESAEYVKRGSGDEKLLLKIFSFVESEFDSECTLSALAREIGYDYSYLSRFFKKAVGITFNAYVNYYRLSHACYLMENSDVPILQCAMESGYASLRSFNRNFKQYFGMTPIEYRKGV